MSDVRHLALSQQKGLLNFDIRLSARTHVLGIRTFVEREEIPVHPALLNIQLSFFKSNLSIVFGTCHIFWNGECALVKLCLFQRECSFDAHTSRFHYFIVLMLRSTF